MKSSGEKKDRLSIFILVTHLERAGAQNVAFAQARYLHAQGHRVMLGFLYDKQGLYDDVARTEAYRVVQFDAKSAQRSSLANGFTTLHAVYRLFRLLRRERFQVIETLSHFSNILGIPVAAWAGVPVRISSQHLPLHRFSRLIIALERWITNSFLTTKRVAVSQETARICIEDGKMHHGKIVVIPNGVDVPIMLDDTARQTYKSGLCAALHIPPDAFLCITVARLHPQKGHQYLLEAAQTLRSRHNVHFLLAGEGVQQDHIERQVTALGLADAVHLLGSRDDVPQLLQVCDMFVLPSLYEGMPLTVIEAMMAGLPVIATSVNGTCEIVDDGETGVLVPPADVDALSSAVERLIVDSDFRQKLGYQGQQHALSEFSSQKMCEDYERLFAMHL